MLRILLVCTDNVSRLDCTFSFVLIMCLTFTDDMHVLYIFVRINDGHACIVHHHLYSRCASLALHIVICTDDVPHLYRTAFFLLHIIVCTALSLNRVTLSSPIILSLDSWLASILGLQRRHQKFRLTTFLTKFFIECK